MNLSVTVRLCALLLTGYCSDRESEFRAVICREIRLGRLLSWPLPHSHGRGWRPILNHQRTPNVTGKTSVSKFEKYAWW
jgi:hypothetical protein